MRKLPTAVRTTLAVALTAAGFAALTGCGSSDLVTPINHDQKVLEQGQKIGNDAKKQFGDVQQQQEQQLNNMLNQPGN